MKLILIVFTFFFLTGCDKEKGIVEKGNLTWMRCSIGQTWDGDECTGEAGRFSWNEHFSAIKQNSGYEGFTDWRLPTSTELNSLVVCSNGRNGFQENGSGGKCKGDSFRIPTIDNDTFPNTPYEGDPRSTWSAGGGKYFTSNGGKPGGNIDFNTGTDEGHFKGGLNHIRLVR